MGDTLQWQRTVPIRHDVDVCVVGGGPAGVAAAVVAARHGCRVFLAEGHSCFGGMSTAGLIPVFMPFTDGVNFLARGIGQEVLQKYRQLVPQDEEGQPGYEGINAELLKRVYDAMVIEAGIAFSFYTHAIGVTMAEPGRAQAVVFSGKSGLFAVRANIFIDCTGDGDLAVWAGASYDIGDENGMMMPATLCNLWANIDWDAVYASHRERGEDEDFLPGAIADGVFSQPDRHLPGMFRVGDRLGGGNISHSFGVDGTDERSITQGLLRGRQVMAEYERYYKAYLHGFEQMELAATAPLLGIRETRRIIGDYILAFSDMEQRAIFADEIGRFAFNVDLHPQRAQEDDYLQHKQRFATLKLGRGESYGIPYRILTPKSLRNVLVAGRCVSADRYMMGSIRVIPGCYITGQAAGMAAALAVAGHTDTRGIDVRQLQHRLQAMGAFLPNFTKAAV